MDKSIKRTRIYSHSPYSLSESSVGNVDLYAMPLCNPSITHSQPRVFLGKSAI